MGMDMKKLLAAAVCAALLTACGSSQPARSSSDEAQAEPTAGAQPSRKGLSLPPCTQENRPAREAYAQALEQLLQEHILPDGTVLEQTGEGDDLSPDQIFVYDLDGDGAEELILLHTSAVMAGQRGYVFGWNAQEGRMEKQLEEFPSLVFYESGAVQADWSHNQGKGGSFWPYTLYRYDAVGDRYVEVGSVDAWDREQFPEGYPDQADTSASGFVYYINTDGTVTWEDPLDVSVYRQWRYPYVREERILAPEYLPLCQETIQLLLRS